MLTLSALLAKDAAGGGARTAPDDPNPDLASLAPLAPVSGGDGVTTDPDDVLGPPVRHSGAGMDEGLTPSPDDDDGGPDGGADVAERADPDIEKYSPSQVRVGAGSPQGGEFAAGSSSSSSSSGGKKAPAKKKPAKGGKAPGKAKRPASGSGLRAEAKADLQQAKALDQRAAGLRSQLAAAKKKLSSLYRIQSSHAASPYQPSAPSSSAAAGSTSAARPGSAGAGAASSASRSQPSGGTVQHSVSGEISAAQHQVSSLSSQLHQVTQQAARLRAEAAQLSHEAAAKKAAVPSPLASLPAPATPQLSRDLIVNGRPVLTQLTPAGVAKRFNPLQPRDHHGRWTHGASGLPSLGSRPDANALAGHVASRDQEAADAIDRGRAAAAEGRHSTAAAHFSNARFALASQGAMPHPHEQRQLTDNESRAEEAFTTQLAGSSSQSGAEAFQAAMWATAVSSMKGQQMTSAEKLMSWQGQSRGHGQLPGHAADSPGSSPASSPLGSFLAQGHPAFPRADGMRLQCHTVTPEPLAQLATVTGDYSMQPLASSIACHQGTAMVQRLDQQNAASPFLAMQTGPNTPSGNPSRPPFSGGTKPTPAQPFVAPGPHPSLGKSGVIPSSAPGAGLSRFTTRIAGNPA